MTRFLLTYQSSISLLVVLYLSADPVLLIISSSLFLLSQLALLLPPCSEEVYHLFPWKQLLIATGGHNCSLIKTNTPKMTKIKDQ